MKCIGVLFLLYTLCASAFSLDREAFTFTNYELNVRVDPSQQRFEARGKIVLRNDSGVPQNHLVLQISSSLHWSSIQRGRFAARVHSQTYTSGIDHTGALTEAIITLPKEVSSGSTIELTVGYEGLILVDTTRLEGIGVPKEIARHNDWDEIGKSFTAVRGIGNVAWYPIATDAVDLNDSHSFSEAVARWKQREIGASMNINLSLVSDSSNSLVGVMNDSAPNSNNGSPPNWRFSFSPMGLTVPSFAIADYVVLDRPSVTIYHLLQHSSQAENYALATELELPLVKDWFGAPRGKIKVLELEDAQSQPFESGTVLLTPLVKDTSTNYRSAAVHQLVHAAFPSSRPWIYEGLAHFAQALETERESGRQAALDFMKTHQMGMVDEEKAIEEKKDKNSSAGESLINTSVEEFYRTKAMYAWWMLRDMVGEKILKQALAKYVVDEDKQPSYLPQLIMAQSHRDLEWFFADWVYRDRGFPDFRVQSAYTRKLVRGGYMVTITIENLGNAGAEVPLTLKIEGGEINQRLEIHAHSKSSIRISTPAIPEEVVINDGSVPESDFTNNSYTDCSAAELIEAQKRHRESSYPTPSLANRNQSPSFSARLFRDV